MDLLTDLHKDNTSLTTKLLKKQLPLRILAIGASPCGICCRCLVEVAYAYALPSW